MPLCDYGCGREGKHQFKNGKWCCSENCKQCPVQQKKHSIKIKEVWKDPNSKLNSISCKEKHSNTMKELHKDSNSKYNSILCNEKRSKTMKGIWKNPDSQYHLDSYKEKQSIIRKESWDDPNSIYNLNAYKNKFKELWDDPNSIYNSILYRKNLSKSSKLTIEKINKLYPFFSKIEKMRYNPDKPEEKEIQVHCKNHNCENSKEKNGWFTPNYEQLRARCNALDREEGNDGNYFYCSQRCKDNCLLYNVHGDPYRDTNKPYTSGELDVFNKYILKRDNEICYYCGDHHATIVHHLRPKKLEPFFALDPDYAISVCAKCHYKYGHPTGSPHSTGNLAKIVCSVESQKFLNQSLEDI